MYFAWTNPQICKAFPLSGAFRAPSPGCLSHQRAAANLGRHKVTGHDLGHLFAVEDSPHRPNSGSVAVIPEEPSLPAARNPSKVPPPLLYRAACASASVTVWREGGPPGRGRPAPGRQDRSHEIRSLRGPRPLPCSLWHRWPAPWRWRSNPTKPSGPSRSGRSAPG